AFELVDLGAAAIADPGHRVQQRRGGQVDHALAAAPCQGMAGIGIPDVGADQVVAEHHVPAAGHDRALAFPRGGDEDQRAGLEETPDLLHRERGLAGQGHGLLLCSVVASVMPQAATLRQSSTWMASARRRTSSGWWLT